MNLDRPIKSLGMINNPQFNLLRLANSFENNGEAPCRRSSVKYGVVAGFNQRQFASGGLGIVATVSYKEPASRGSDGRHGG